MEEIKDFKTSAKEAKTRFKRGFWNSFNERKAQKILEAKEKGFCEQDVIRMQTEKAKRDIKMQFDKKTDEDILYEKVVQILSSDEIILNPIKRLINGDEFEVLGENEKQLYILNLTTKFNALKERYNKEKFLS